MQSDMKGITKMIFLLFSSHLNTNLRHVVRVGELSGNKKKEIRTVGYVRVSKV